MQPEYGIVMNLNLDVYREYVVSYDVLMHSAEVIATVKAKHVENDVGYAKCFLHLP